MEDLTIAVTDRDGWRERVREREREKESEREIERERESQGNPCWQRDLMTMMYLIYIYIYIKTAFGIKQPTRVDMP